MKRPTMADIARRAGVTKSAVSFALNGRPGVSEPTRRRILAIAHDVGWQPNSAAKALSDGRAGAFGLVVDRPAHTLGLEPFLMQLISGIQAELSRDSTPLLFTMAEGQQAEIALYRAWAAQRLVDGVFLVDLRVEDPRVPLLQELQLPAVVIGAPVGTGSLPAVWSDDATAVSTAVRHLAALGHHRVARVTGPVRLRHTVLRGAAFTQATADAGMLGSSVETDYSGRQSAAATHQLLAAKHPPTAIIYDSDVMAVSGLTAAQSRGLRIPGDMSIVAWDDSALCELVSPPLTALSRDIPAYGAHAASRLRAIVDGTAGPETEAPAPRLTVRESTARARVQR